MAMSKFIHRGLLSLTLVILLTSCATTATKNIAPTTRLVWPPPPMEARIEWVKEYKILAETAERDGFWGKIKDFFIGSRVANMVRPYGVCTDNVSQLFIADAGGGKVHVFDMQDEKYDFVEGEGESRLKSPIGVVYAQGYLYITDSMQRQIFQYDLQTKSLKPWNLYNLERPTGIAFDRVTHLFYVSDTTAHQIIVLDQNGSEKFRFGARGTAAGQFNFPTDIWISGEGRIYVTDSLNARVQVFSKDGDYLSEFGHPGDTPGSFSKPKGVAVDPHGNIFVCDALFDAIQIFDQTGQVLLSFGDNGMNPGQFWMPSGIYIDKKSHVYVADTYNRRIQVFKILIE